MDQSSLVQQLSAALIAQEAEIKQLTADRDVALQGAIEFSNQVDKLSAAIQQITEERDVALRGAINFSKQLEAMKKPATKPAARPTIVPIISITEEIDDDDIPF